MSANEYIQRNKPIPVEKALERLKWRFANHKNINPNATDIAALNSIIAWVNRQQAVPLKRHSLFAKMYIMLYGLFLKHYNTDPMNPLPEQELHRLLDRDMGLIVHEFWQELNFDSMTRRLEPLRPESTKGKHPAMKTPEEEQAFLDNFNALPEEEKKTFWQKEYDLETVTDILNSMVNEAINRYGND